MKSFQGTKVSPPRVENTEIPAEFDANTYRLHPTNADLQRLTDVEAASHYQNFGRQEGRISSAVDSRLSLLKLLPARGPILEIGPFCTPSLLRPDKDVYYLDAFSTKTLREKAAKLSWADPAKVPEIDFVWDGRPYTALTDKRFPAVFSSHTIEHQPCLISHLNDVASILDARGRYFLVIPDKRYCFDHYIPQTTIADVLAAYALKAKKHSVRTVMQDRIACFIRTMILVSTGRADMDRTRATLAWTKPGQRSSQALSRKIIATTSTPMVGNSLPKTSAI